ncbi:DUF3592 domain-containing protein [Chitinophaga flava]|uniref:DUF3592 domain-containing protein n=1 Tax=Chitinophaga flava TaxID=2259036 RepID=A0A365XU66_9BACT|nr:DUF3592 domain-containing protein [Chitinophaga flava]RBL89889.1 hypothetical protein DF182_25760 [Chitinophaga flava]
MGYKLSLLTGLILLAVSLYKLKQSIDFIGRSERAMGIVISLEEDGDGAYSPVFVVKTKEDEIIYHHSVANSPATWHIGEEAIFLYDPGNPGSVTMMGYFWLFNWTIFSIAIAIPLIIFGLSYYLINPLMRLQDESH